MDISQLFGLILPLLFIFIISIIFSIFSPFGIIFILFTLIRQKTPNPRLRLISLISQIILVCFNFALGLLISLLFLFRDSGFYVHYSLGWMFSLAVISGVGFVTLIFVSIIIFQTRYLNNKNKLN